MKGRIVILDRLSSGQAAAALMVDGRLDDLIIDPVDQSRDPMVGDLFVAKITRKLPNKGGAFAELGGGQSGFLRDAREVSEGAWHLVQVTSLPERGKATTVSARVLFKGAHLILTPGAPGVNVSRQIKDHDERDRLTQGATAALEAFGNPGLGLIVRTSATNATGETLQSELSDLISEMESAEDALANRKPCHKPLGSAHEVWKRDWITPPPDQVIFNTSDAPTFGASYDDIEKIGLKNPFEAQGVADEMDALDHSVVPIGPGTMVIEPTTALVAVDVNTGGDFSPASALKTNIAAIRDLPRQLRLRGLGGQIVVDFAPMPKRERRGFEASVKAAFRRDPVETSLVGWTEMGLYELQRKRERRPLKDLL